jgi:voltage-gated potassium channel
VSAARWVRLLGIQVLLVILFFVVPVSASARGGLALRVVVSLLVLGALAATVIAQVKLSAEDPNRHVDGLVVVIVAVWLVFAIGFFILARHQPGQVAGLETRVDALYFTASTMLTVGYGDVHATGQVARGLVLVQMLFDVVFVATAVTMITTRIRNRVGGPAAVPPAQSPPPDPGPKA